jgi:hypothetical protein
MAMQPQTTPQQQNSQMAGQQQPQQVNQQNPNQNSMQPENPNVPQKGTDVFKKWWFWVILGIVIVGGVLAIYLLL